MALTLGPPPPGHGAIYRVPGKDADGTLNTESGKDYIGSTDNLKTRGEADGRKRSKGKVVDHYQIGKDAMSVDGQLVNERWVKERAEIDGAGGLGALDNKINPPAQRAVVPAASTPAASTVSSADCPPRPRPGGRIGFGKILGGFAKILPFGLGAGLEAATADNPAEAAVEAGIGEIPFVGEAVGTTEVILGTGEVVSDGAVKGVKALMGHGSSWRYWVPRR